MLNKVAGLESARHQASMFRRAREAQAYAWIAVCMAIVLVLSNSLTIHAAPLAPPRRVNAPYFPDNWIQDFWVSEAAIFWFGQVTQSENYTDVRVAYDSQELLVHVSVIDRRIWYDTNPSSDSLTNWDSVTLYFNLNGNAGNTPDTASYRLDAQVSAWEPRADRQAAYRGNGTGWISASIPFTTSSSYRGQGGPNKDANNRGWFVTFHIPFSSLGLSGPPPQGKTWGMAVVNHDRDYAPPAPMNPDKTWPEYMDGNQPATWGQLSFGLLTYTAPAALPGGAVTIRNGSDGIAVTDAAVGGTTGNLCPGDENYIWSGWGQANFAGATDLNVQNQVDLGDWPCFAKYYVTFPLDSIPAGQVILSATLTLVQFGNAGQGYDPGPESSYIQALTVNEDWDASTVNWNNAPLAKENITGIWVDPVPAPPPVPNVFRTWDVSPAVADAYAAGQPLRLALYSSDMPQHSGRYFWSSYHDDPNARPTLAVTWGVSTATLRKIVSPAVASTGQPVTFSLNVVGNGRALTLTDNLSLLFSAPGPIRLEGNGTATYDQVLHRLTWTGTPAAGQRITLTFPLTIAATSAAVIRNTAVLTDATSSAWTDSATVIANASQVWLPVVLRQ